VIGPPRDASETARYLRESEAGETRNQMNVWLWDASGPARTACGVTDSESRARRAAEAVLTSGQADAARIEQAALGLGAGTMTYGYQRTGRARHARVRNGHVTWEPIALAPQLAAS
jgi:hypothetical protein